MAKGGVMGRTRRRCSSTGRADVGTVANAKAAPAADHPNRQLSLFVLAVLLSRAAMWAWEAGVTPHALIRGMGPWGPRWALVFAERRVWGSGGQLLMA